MKLTLLLFVALFFVACSTTSPSTVPPTPAPTVDVPLIQTRSALSVFATQTASAPTTMSTSTPTQSPSQTPTIFYVVITNTPTRPLVATSRPKPSVQSPDDVLKAFQSAGLEVENVRAMTKEDYGLAPLVCDGRRFLIPALGPDKGGRVFICANPKERESLANYYRNLSKASAAFFSWVYVKGSVVLQLNGDLNQSLAEKYSKAIP